MKLQGRDKSQTKALDVMFSFIVLSVSSMPLCMLLFVMSYALGMSRLIHLAKCPRTGPDTRRNDEALLANRRISFPSDTDFIGVRGGSDTHL